MPIVASALASLTLMQLTGADIARAEQTRLNACIQLTETNPEAAYEDGLAWSYEGNRPGARYCTALALIALGQPGEGAARLETLANATDAGSVDERAVFLAQAGNAWIAAGAPEAAIVALTNGLKLSPDHPDILKDRAAAYMLMREWGKALVDLDQVVSAYATDAEALRLRANAHLKLDNLTQALSDIENAMAVDSKNIDTLVLRGRIREEIRLSKLIELE